MSHPARLPEGNAPTRREDVAPRQAGRPVSILARLLLPILCLLALAAPASAQNLTELDPPTLQQRQQQDLDAVLRWRAGLRDALDYAATQPQLFKADGKAVLPDAQREALRGLWQRLSDYHLALDSIARYHADFHRLPDGPARAASFRIGELAFLAQYRHALDFIAASGQAEPVDILLNEAQPATGLPAGSFDRYKFRFLNIAIASEFAARELLRRQYAPQDEALVRLLDEDAAAILARGTGKGQSMTAANALDVVRKAGFGVWFPVQAGVAEWMGDTKVLRPQQNLISPEQARSLPARLEPGDILLERREWYLSNAGLPGYWPHAALYVGSPEERARYFEVPEVQEWVKTQGEPSGRLEDLLRRVAPGAQADSLAPRHDGNPARVLEAVSEGVVFTSIEHTADADTFAALRPRLSRLDKAKALLRAYSYHGRPYDFNFDFRSDATLVCSELVYKAYEPRPDFPGIALPIKEVLGRLATSPNDIVQLYDQQFDDPAQAFDFVLFLDGNEGSRKAMEADEAAFRQSWKRPKWHLMKGVVGR